MLRFSTWLSGTATVALLVVACGGTTESGTPTDTLDGTAGAPGATPNETPLGPVVGAEARWGAALGAWLLFDSDANVGLRNAYCALLGTETVLVVPTSTGPFDSPTVSDDGVTIAMVRNAGAEIVTASADAQSFYRVEESPTSPSWSPDGATIAYASGGAAYLLDVESRDSTRVGAEPDGSIEHVRFVDDGAIVVSDESSIWQLDLQGGKIGTLVTASNVRVALSDVSETGEELLFDADCPDGIGVRSAHFGETVEACDAPLVSPPGVGARRGAYGLGGSLAYEVGEPGTAGSIWVLPAAGGRPVQLTNGSGDHRNPTFAPASFIEPELLSGGPMMWPTIAP